MDSLIDFFHIVHLLVAFKITVYLKRLVTMLKLLSFSIIYSQRTVSQKIQENSTGQAHAILIYSNMMLYYHKLNILHNSKVQGRMNNLRNTWYNY